MANYSSGGERPRENRPTFDQVVACTHNIEQRALHPESLSSFWLLPRA
jgi:hypothetical protein